MDLTEQTVDELSVFKGKIVHLKQLTVRLQNGQIAKREVILHPGAVAILAEPTPNHIVLVSQYRKAPECTLLEIPAGKLEENEDPVDAARRELREETGYIASELTLVHEFYTSPGFANEKIYLYYATNLLQGAISLDENEFVEMKSYLRAEILEMLTNQQIHDAKTLIALLWWCKKGELD